MAQPGTKSPPNEFPKSAGQTKLPYADECKCIKEKMLEITEVSDIGSAPTSRVYTKDYKKVGRSPDDTDTVSPALGNPFRL